MDELYKAILKNYSIKLADTTNIYDSSKEWLYIIKFIYIRRICRKHIVIKNENRKQKKKI